MNYYFFFFIFQRSTFNLEKNKSICEGKFLVHLIQVTGSTHCGSVFQTMYITKRYIHKIEQIRKNLVCVDLRNFANL